MAVKVTVQLGSVLGMAANQYTLDICMRSARANVPKRQSRVRSGIQRKWSPRPLLASMDQRWPVGRKISQNKMTLR